MSPWLQLITRSLLEVYKSFLYYCFILFCSLSFFHSIFVYCHFSFYFYFHFYFTTFVFTILSGSVVGGSGTSASSPSFAGLFTLVNAQRVKLGQSPLGFVNPLLYAGYESFTNDITSGFNNCAGVIHNLYLNPNVNVC